MASNIECSPTDSEAVLQEGLEDGDVRMVCFDLDGVLAKAPRPGKTAMKLLFRRYSVPKPGKHLYHFRPNNNPLTPVLQALTLPLSPILEHCLDMKPYNRRPVAEGAIEGLDYFQGLGNRYGLNIRLGVLSGRDLPYHQATHEWLQAHGLMDYFNEEDISLNVGDSSSRYKVLDAFCSAIACRSFMQVDDDVNPLLGIAQWNGKVVDLGRGREKTLNVGGYLIKNITNRPGVLSWGKVELPENIIAVNSVYDAALEYEYRILNGLV